jgi:hypothetical protein
MILRDIQRSESINKYKALTLAHMELNRPSGLFAVEFQADIRKIDLLASCVLRHETWATMVCSNRMVEDMTFDQFYDSAASHLTELATKRILDLTNLTCGASDAHHPFDPLSKIRGPRNGDRDVLPTIWN